jgi:type II secretory pathway pseudopilin PulG
MNNQKGISVIELILVLAVMGVLVALFIVARNPSTQAAINRNQQREFDIIQIAQAVHQYKIHHKNNYPKTNEGEKIVDCSESDLTVGSSLTEALVPDYLTEVSKDPKTDSQYQLCIVKEEDGDEEVEKIKVIAPDSELDKQIEIIR